MRKVVTTSAAVLFFSFVLDIAAHGQAPKPGPEQKNLKHSSDPGHLSGTPSQAFSVPAGR